MKMLSEGDVIAARNPKDDKWYRGKITQIISDEWTNTAIYVEFCDFGFEAQLEYNDIRDLEPNFLLLPFQALQCRLADIQAAPSDANDAEIQGADDDDDESIIDENNNHLDKGYVTASEVDSGGHLDGWSQKAVSFFRKLVQGKPLLAQVKYVVGPHHYLELFGASNINHLMKAKGFAVSSPFRPQVFGIGGRIHASPGFLPQPG